MRKIHTIPIFAVLALAISFSVPQVFAEAQITASPTSGSYLDTITLTGSGFAPNTNVSVCVDSTNAQETITTDSNGAFTKSFPVPPSASLGQTTINLSSDSTCPGTLASTPFLVTSPTSIPDFPFSFSLVIMFVAVAGVYLAIRQKMTTNFFKPF